MSLILVSMGEAVLILSMDMSVDVREELQVATVRLTIMNVAVIHV